MMQNIDANKEMSVVDEAEQRPIDKAFKVTKADTILIVAFVFCVIVGGAMIIVPLIWTIMNGTLGSWIGLIVYYGVLVLLFVCLSDD